MNEQQIFNDLSAYGTVVILNIDSACFLVVIEGVNTDEFLEVGEYLKINVRPEYPFLNSFSYDGNVIKAMFVKTNEATDEFNNQEIEA